MTSKRVIGAVILGAGGLLLLFGLRAPTARERTRARLAKLRAAGSTQLVAVRMNAIISAFQAAGGVAELGRPTTGVVSAPGGGMAQGFEGSVSAGAHYPAAILVAPGASQGFVVRQNFLLLWEARGGVEGPGYPLENARWVSSGVARQRFEHEKFHWYEAGKGMIVRAHDGRVLQNTRSFPPRKKKEKSWLDETWEWTKENAGTVGAVLYTGAVVVGYGALVVGTGGAALIPGAIVAVGGGAIVGATGIKSTADTAAKYLP